MYQSTTKRIPKWRQRWCSCPVRGNGVAHGKGVAPDGPVHVRHNTGVERLVVWVSWPYRCPLGGMRNGVTGPNLPTNRQWLTCWGIRA